MDIEQVSSSHHKYYDKLPSESIARQKFLCLMERVAAPEITRPRRESYLKEDVEEDKENPNLGLFLQMLSQRAQEEWINWVESFGEDQDIAKILLEEEEYAEFIEYLKQVEEDEQAKLDSSRSKQNIAISCTPGFIQAKISDLETVSSGRTQSELDLYRDRSELETKGRSKVRDEEPDFSFLDPKRDPDFANPLTLSNSSRGGYLFKVVSRPYNLTFGISYTDDNGVVKFSRSNPKSDKDYSTVEDITYLLKDKNLKDLKVTVVTPESNIQWEPDLRISPLNTNKVIKNLIPDPINYKKVDSKSVVGRRLLRSLKENPYHEWTEVSWEWDEEKKVALVRETAKGLYWIYLDRSEVLPYTRIKVVYPQVEEIWDMTYNSRARYIVMYKVRISDYNELPEPFNNLVKDKFTDIVNNVINKGFVFVSKSKHDDFGAIVYSFVRNDLLSVKQRYLERKND